MNQIIDRPILRREPAWRPKQVDRLSVSLPANRRVIFIVGFLAIHIPLGLLTYRVNVAAMAHPWAVVLCCTVLVIRSRQLITAAYAAAYIIGAEVMWRMTESGFYYEGGKYVIATLFIIALAKRRLFRRVAFPLAYFVLLIPSVALTVSEVSLDRARDMLSFNLSGPFALAVSACFFSNLKMSKEQFLRLLLTLMGPIVSIATVTMFSIVTATDLTFNTESNYTASGGFGPNQVSAILGLGTFFGLLYAFISVRSWVIRLLMVGMALWFAIQSAMTFSRGGLYMAAGALIGGCFWLLRDGRTRVQMLVVGGILFVVVNYYVLPRLDKFTGGTLTERFQDTGTTGRGDIIMSDLSIWKNSPALGVGPGLSRSYRDKSVVSATAHTEFSRLLAEHGALGLLAAVLLFVMAFRNLHRTHFALNKAIVTSMTAWSFLFMSSAAMRTGAPSFIFGLGFALLSANKDLRSRILPHTLRRFPHKEGRESGRAHLNSQ